MRCRIEVVRHGQPSSLGGSAQLKMSENPRGQAPRLFPKGGAWIDVEIRHHSSLKTLGRVVQKGHSSLFGAVDVQEEHVRSVDVSRGLPLVTSTG